MGRFLIVLCLLFINFGCYYQSPVNCFDRQDYELVLSGEEAYPLDNSSTFRPTAVYTYNVESETSFLIVDNEQLGRIDIYNSKTKQLHKRIQLTGEGPNGIKYRPSGYFFHNMDSIFLFFNVTQELYLIDSGGVIKNKMGPLTKWTEQSKMPTIDVSGGMKPLLRKNTIEFCTYGLASSNGKAGVIYDLVNQTARFPYTLPAIYKRGWWSGLLYDRFSQAYNEEENLVVLSYGADKFIYIVNQHGEIRKECASSRYLPEQLKPYATEAKSLDVNYQELWKYEALQGSYSTIIYDRWREVYYRVAFRSLSESEYTSPHLVWSKPVIIILDRQFKKIGESVLPQGYYHAVHYVTPEGIYFANRDAYDRNDNLMTFGRFSLQKAK
jgi:hypothetical protein